MNILHTFRMFMYGYVTLFFFKDGTGIKYPMNVDMPLNKETKEIIFLDTQNFMMCC